MSADFAARYLVLAASNRLICCDWIDGGWRNTGVGGTTHGGSEFGTPPGEVADRADGLASVPWPAGRKRMGACPLFVELCCGSAAVTLRLLGGRHARPPVSYQGSKHGYASTILHVLGLRSGQGADAVVLNDPGPWSKVWRVLVDTAGARRVASIIRGWVGEDPRALWERLRAEPVPADDGEAAARWAVVSYLSRPGTEAFKRTAWGDWPDDPPDLANMRVGPFAFPAGTLVLGEDAAAIEPRDVARWMWLNGRSWGRKGERAGFDGHSSDDDCPRCGGRCWATTLTPAALARTAEAYRWPPALVSNLDAADIRPVPPLPPGTVCYIDPPYQGTTGYAHAFPRAAVLDVAARWRDAGARVAVSEAEPLPLPGWHHVEITGERRGQKRTFSKQQAEWLTLSHEPAWRPATQGGLFGEAEEAGP